MAIPAGETLQERTKGKDVRLSNIVAAKVSLWHSCVCVCLYVCTVLSVGGLMDQSKDPIVVVGCCCVVWCGGSRRFGRFTSMMQMKQKTCSHRIRRIPPSSSPHTRARPAVVIAIARE